MLLSANSMEIHGDTSVFSLLTSRDNQHLGKSQAQVGYWTQPLLSLPYVLSLEEETLLLEGSG